MCYPFELYANILWKFFCQCDMTFSYVGYNERQVVTRVREHSNFNFTAKSAIKNHSCPECIEKHFSVNDRAVLKKCYIAYEAKTQEALMMKKQNSKLYRHWFKIIPFCKMFIKQWQFAFVCAF